VHTSLSEYRQPGSSPLDMQAAVGGDTETLHLIGELDLESSASVDAAVRHICAGANISVMVLDLRRVTFMDSTGLRAILKAKTLCARSGIELRVVPGPPQVRRLFEITGVQHQVIFGTPDGSGS
jgi:anti-anti-sigma factor